MKNYVLYSQGTRLSYEINKKYYNDVHFVWCCEKIFLKVQNNQKHLILLKEHKNL